MIQYCFFSNVNGQLRDVRHFWLPERIITDTITDPPLSSRKLVEFVDLLICVSRFFSKKSHVIIVSFPFVRIYVSIC